ncbi:MAG: hypothetical protein GTO60_11175, partial [Gammaproteobacteria bacterium]|nr:hypothetical protein [Gammaproteobacteria bacterium]
GERHTLPLINIFTPDARLVSGDSSPEMDKHQGENSTPIVLQDPREIGIPEKFWGLDRFEARKLIVTELESAGLLEKT